jgi:hypothetical protein
MSARLRRKVVLVTSGLGTAHGGIGVVSQSILKALAGEHEVALWRHPVVLPRPLRKGMFAAHGWPRPASTRTTWPASASSPA